MTTAIAFSNASLVRMSRAVMPWRSSSTTASPERCAKSSRRRSTRGRRGGAGQRHAERLGDATPSCWRCTCRRRRPRPGRSRTRCASTSSRLIRPAGARADGLERVDDRDVLLGAVAERDPARHDRAGVEEDGGEVEPRRGHQHAGQRLVAAGQQHRAVEALGHHDGLDRVGDDLARDEREVHALVAHRDAVGDRDRAELQRVAAGRVHALLGAPARAGRGDRLHGVISFHEDAMPICGLSQSSSPMPTARSMPRAAARSMPSVTSTLRGLMFGASLMPPSLFAGEPPMQRRAVRA